MLKYVLDNLYLGGDFSLFVTYLLTSLFDSFANRKGEKKVLWFWPVASNKGPRGCSVAPPPTGVRGRMERKRQNLWVNIRAV